MRMGKRRQMENRLQMENYLQMKKRLQMKSANMNEENGTEENYADNNGEVSGDKMKKFLVIIAEKILQITMKKILQIIMRKTLQMVVKKLRQIAMRKMNSIILKIIHLLSLLNNLVVKARHNIPILQAIKTPSSKQAIIWISLFISFIRILQNIACFGILQCHLGLVQALQNN